MRPIRPDYPKIIFVGIPIGFVAWFVFIFPSALVARAIGNIDYWLHISLLFTVIFISGYLAFCIKNPRKIGAAIINDPNILRPAEDEFRCGFCGKAIANDQPVNIWQKSISGKNVVCCVDCYRKKTHGSYKTPLLFSVVPLLIGIGLIVFSPGERFGWFLVNLFLVQAFSISMIVPHELGHVLAAKSLGVFVPCVVIGFGKTVVLKRFRNISWEFKSIPAGGITIPLILATNNYRRKLFLIVLGGPLINSFAIFALLLFYPGYELVSDIFSPRLSIASAFFWANTEVLLTNLLPFRYYSIMGKTDSDGLNMIKLPFLAKEEIEQRVENDRAIFSQLGITRHNE